MSNVMNKANELGEALKQDERFLNYESKKELHDNDMELQGLISEFNLIRMNLNNEMQNDQRDEDKVAFIQNELERLYAMIMEKPAMQDFMEARQGLEELVNGVYSVINFYITGEEPQQEGGCDPSACSSCGGGCGGH